MRNQDREALMKAKAEHRESKKGNNRALYIEKRNQLVKHILKSNIPNWGSFKLSINNKI